MECKLSGIFLIAGMYTYMCLQLCLGRHCCQGKDSMRELGLPVPAGCGDAQAWYPMGQINI